MPARLLDLSAEDLVGMQLDFWTLDPRDAVWLVQRVSPRDRASTREQPQTPRGNWSSGYEELREGTPATPAQHREQGRFFGSYLVR